MNVEGEEADAFAEQLARLDLGLLIASSASTIASLAFGKLERGELEQARKGIDAVAALLPLLDEAPRKDLAVALANLQVEYAARVSAS